MYCLVRACAKRKIEKTSISWYLVFFIDRLVCAKLGFVFFVCFWYAIIILAFLFQFNKRFLILAFDVCRSIFFGLLVKFIMAYLKQLYSYNSKHELKKTCYKYNIPYSLYSDYNTLHYMLQ